jgi:glycosyltransferase involved in cell wall biosynthesis
MTVTMKKKVIIEPTSRIWYSSFYIKGLYKVFGRKNISFSSKYFSELLRKNDPHSYDKYMAFVVLESNSNPIRYIIDFGDSNSISENAYSWCDRYAKINFNSKITNRQYRNKIIAIPPSFGIKIWNFFDTIYYCVKNFRFSIFKFSPAISLKNYLIDYYRHYKRPKLESYSKNFNPKETKHFEPYIFIVATLWNHQNCINETNVFRKSFMEVCKSSNYNFEGGFYSPKNSPQLIGYRNHLITKRYTTSSYLKKSQMSTVVFNTPSVHNCHGWKLGEFLALGKAIISTPLSNNLSENLQHGENVHFISNIKELNEAVKLLINDRNYRKKLEHGAKKYYSKFVCPEKVIRNIIT